MYACESVCVCVYVCVFVCVCMCDYIVHVYIIMHHIRTQHIHINKYIKGDKFFNDDL